MTLDGTNTYVLAEPGSREVVVVDPGPAGPHLDVVAHVAEAGHRRVALVVLTHGHADHAQGAPALAEAVGAPVLAADPRHGAPFAQRVHDVAGLRLEVVSTPGHTADSVCLLLPDERALLTGDTLLGRGTTVVAHPDGRLSDYLASLERLEQIAAPGLTLLPGHGPAGRDVADLVREYRAHRADRLEQVVVAVRRGARDADGVVAAVYADVPQVLWPAARLSVLAQLDHLVAEGRLVRQGDALSAPGV
jgi:glyoxylase-like metal-dependent hydrolase (beta-lactamase superfamily II)